VYVKVIEGEAPGTASLDNGKEVIFPFTQNEKIDNKKWLLALEALGSGGWLIL